MDSDRYQRVIEVSELPVGRMSSCQVAGREIVICHSAAGFHALAGVCTHAESRMAEGRLRGTRIICPLHAAAFDVRDGRVLSGPATQPLDTYDVRIRDGAVEVAVEARGARALGGNAPDC